MALIRGSVGEFYQGGGFDFAGQNYELQFSVVGSDPQDPFNISIDDFKFDIEGAVFQNFGPGDSFAVDLADVDSALAEAGADESYGPESFRFAFNSDESDSTDVTIFFRRLDSNGELVGANEEIEVASFTFANRFGPDFSMSLDFVRDPSLTGIGASPENGSVNFPRAQEGNGGVDVITSGAFNDRLEGGAGDDTLMGGLGEDRLFGEDGDDILDGGGDNDEIRGGRNNDTIDGGAGNDDIAGGDGNDMIRGGDGDDRIRLNDPANQFDMFENPDGETYRLVHARGDGSDGTDTIHKDVEFYYVLGNENNIRPITDLLSTGPSRLEIDFLNGFQGGVFNEGVTGSVGRIVVEDPSGQTIAPSDLDYEITGAAAAFFNVSSQGVISLASPFLFRSLGAQDPAPVAITVAASLKSDASESIAIQQTLQVRDVAQVETLDPTERIYREFGVAETRVVASDSGADIRGNPNVAQSDVFIGGAGADSLDGEEGDDTLQGLGGDDEIIGGDGDGTDVALFRGRWDEYDVTALSQGFRVRDLFAKRDGTDDVVGVEVFRFSDGDRTQSNVLTPPPSDLSASLTAVEAPEEVDAPIGRLQVSGTSLTLDQLFFRFTLDGALVTDRFSVASNGELLAQNGGVDFETEDGAALVVAVSETANFSDAASASMTLHIRDARDPLIDMTEIGPAFTDVGVQERRVDGTLGDDVITGFDGPSGDQLWGLGGNDTINGLRGGDFINGGGGADVIDAGGGNDLVFGGPSRDVIDGGSGNDTLSGNDGNDEIFGGFGADRINGLNGRDDLRGGSGADVIYGNNGVDRLSGGKGDDRLFGGDGGDTILGASGEDFIEGGRNNDVIYGGGDNDTIAGQLGDDALFGADGDDRLFGGSGEDRLEGGAGVDSLNGQLNRDILIGGAGADTFWFSPGGDEVRDFESGLDKIGVNGTAYDVQDFNDLVVSRSGADVVLRIGSELMVLRDLDTLLTESDVMIV